MSNSRVKPMVEGGILSAVAILFALISVYIPLIGAFVNMIWPVPIILLGVRHGYKWSLMATVVAGILIAILLHPLHAVGVAIGFGLTGIALGQCFRRNLSPVHSVLIGSVASLASKLIVLAISAAVMGINPLADWTGEDVEAWLDARDLPRHPLVEQGYRSIGCWPCTRAVDDEEDARAGRWSGMDKVECGIHLGKRKAA